MKHLLCGTVLRLATTASALAVTAVAGGGAAFAQATPLSLPAMPMADALQQIAAATGTAVAFDPDAVRGLTSSPVKGARNVRTAIHQATAATSLVTQRQPDGSYDVGSDVLVVARRDEAETSLLVRGATTSTRTGQSLRDQPRNTQVISSRLMQEQQSQTLTDALRNAGGVSISSAAVQGGVSYSVRGFGAGGVVNGLPGASNSGFATGATLPIANVERIEVLKGPDALLAGANNLGGTVNIVTKKPDAETRLYLSAETGSFGQARVTIDANTALNASRTVSARIIAGAATADRNYGGYRGNEDYVYAPSLRFKDADTDVIVGLTLSNQIFGVSPYLPLNPATNAPFDLPTDRPLLRRANQGIQIRTTTAYGEATRKVSDWLTLVARGQHQKLTLDIGQYSPFAVIDRAGTLLISNSRSRQAGNADAFDGYARFTAATFGIQHTLTTGYTYVENDLVASSSSASGMFPYNFLTATAPPRDLARLNRKDHILASTQNGYYAQYLAKAWKLSLLASVRHNKYESTLTNLSRPRVSIEGGSKSTPSFGLVFDAMKNVSLFGSLSYGYSPTFQIGRDREKLPDVKSRNMEAGAKIDLFDKRMLVNASVFRIRQSNTIVIDATDFLFNIAVPGQQGTGIDLNASGEIVKGWTVQGAYTRTKYENLTFSQFGNTVVGQPKHQYSAYTSYRRQIDDDVTAGLGGGVFGRSSASINTTGSYRVPTAVQVDLNAFLKVSALDVNLGVRNLFDRRNYGVSYAGSSIPVSEPRNWRVTVGYRFQ